MKKMLSVITALLMMLLLSACGSSTTKNTAGTSAPQEESAAPAAETGKTLVVYFTGTGNTSVLAHNAAAVLGADIFEIKPAQPYTSDDLNYNNKSARATAEQNDPSARPKMANRVEHLADYTTVVLAYPIWWGQAPRIMDTFVESYDFSGKTIAPICTSGSSDIDASAAILTINMTGAANWKEGRRFESSASADDLRDWFKELGLMQ